MINSLERYMPGMTVDLIFRHDRFGRGGDRTSFVAQGFAAIRLPTPSENYANQHTATDTFANASVPYTTRVAKMNAAVLATLALAPKPPAVSVPRPAGGRGAGRAAESGSGADTAAAGDPAGGRGGRGGPPGPGLSRGKGYDAVARWAMPSPEPDIAGYSLLIRDTTAPLWQREIYVGNVTEYTIPDTSIDDIVVGVRAIDKDGNPSLVSAYAMAPTRLIEPPSPATALIRPASGAANRRIRESAFLDRAGPNVFKSSSLGRFRRLSPSLTRSDSHRRSAPAGAQSPRVPPTLLGDPHNADYFRCVEGRGQHVLGPQV